jgi:lactoylglutathione lyase
MTPPSGAYFIVYVADMDRAAKFYEETFEALVSFRSPEWTSLRIAGVSIGLHGGSDTTPRRIGLGFDVDDIDGTCAAIARGGGAVVKAPEHKPDEGITLAEVADTEGNQFSLTLTGHQ